MSRWLVLTILVLGLASPMVRAETRSDRDRVLQLVPIAAGGTVYLVLELGLKDAITPDHCRWCSTNGFDLAIRNALVWEPQKVRLASTLSNLTGYLGNPVFATGVLMASTANDPSGRVWFDDTIPVFQSAIVTGVVNQTVKVIFGRPRPYSQLGGVSTRAANDVNTSFFSGHTALAFTVTTSSAMVAHLRGYRSEAALWIGGGALAVATGYLRIAADAHYATDVITGALVGGAIGVAIPLLFHKDVLEPDPVGPTPRVASGREPTVFSFGGTF